MRTHKQSAPRNRAAPSVRSWRSGPANVLTRYAERGVFRSFTATPAGARRISFLMGWHRERNFEFVVDSVARTIRVPVLLPHVPARSAMERAYRAFLKDFQNGSMPPHRCVDPRRAILRCANRGGALTLSIEVLDGDYRYATEKLLAVVHETYLLFLQMGGYADYMIEHLGASPDWGR